MDTKQQAIFFNTPIESNHIGAILTEIYGYLDENRNYIRGVYDQFLAGKKDLIILDIGGNIGLTSYYFSRFAKQVYTLEPAKEHFENLSKQLEFNGIKNVKPINKALWIEDTKKILVHTSNKTMFSLHLGVQNTGQVDPNYPPEDVETIKLDTLFKNEGIEHVDFMKLDAEGTEVEIVSSDSFSNVANKIDVIFGETHDWSDRNPNQLRDALEGNGFSFEFTPEDRQKFIARRK